MSKETQIILSFLIFCAFIGYVQDLSFFYFLAVTIAILSWVSPPLRKIVIKYWILLTTWLRRISSIIILTSIYILILLPVSLLYRIRNRDILQLNEKYPGYWHNRDKTYKKEDFIQPW